MRCVRLGKSSAASLICWNRTTLPGWPGGRITAEGVQEILQQELGAERQSIAGLIDLQELRISQLLKLVYPISSNELDWVLAEADSLRRFQSTIPLEHCERLLNETRHWLQTAETSGTGSALELFRSVYKGGRRGISEPQVESVCAGLLWRICLRRLETSRPPTGELAKPIRLRDAVLSVTGKDADELVHDALAGFCAGWLDQGYAQWQMPGRDAGFLAAFCAVYGGRTTGQRRWLRDLPEALQGWSNGRALAPMLHDTRVWRGPLELWPFGGSFSVKSTSGFSLF